MGIWTYLEADERESRELALCFSGTQLGEVAGAQVLVHVREHPLDVDARLKAIGYCNASSRNADWLVLWLVERMPEVAIENFWMISSNTIAVAERLWRSAFEKHKSAQVFENAARSTVDADPEFSEQAYSAGEETSEVDTAWFCRKAAFYEVQMMNGAPERERLARKALNAILRAIELEGSPLRQGTLLWTAREYARSASDREVARLLREADAARKGREEDRQRQTTALGLVALARGDEVHALKLLQESSQHLQAGVSPSLALARALVGSKNAFEGVLNFLHACVDANVAEGDRIAAWAVDLKNGAMPSLLLETHQGAANPEESGQE